MLHKSFSFFILSVLIREENLKKTLSCMRKNYFLIMSYRFGVWVVDKEF